KKGEKNQTDSFSPTRVKPIIPATHFLLLSLMFQFWSGRIARFRYRKLMVFARELGNDFKKLSSQLIEIYSKIPLHSLRKI
ncbi:hypothetical protein COW68_03470, partial [Candidatus Gracilibacteria bacterium CG18_big_fil_WC_8_21_14_2_50_38_16]